MKEEKKSLTEALAAINHRTLHTLQSIQPLFPYFADPVSGEWETTDDGNWCAGHWIGLLQIAHKYASGSEKTAMKNALERYTDIAMQAYPKFSQSLFAGMNYHYIGFRGYDYTQNPELLQLGFKGADVIINLYHPVAKQVPSGEYTLKGPGPAHVAQKGIATWETKTRGWHTAGYAASAVDAAYVAIPVLWRAFQESKDEKYLKVAVSHMEVYLERFIREDGSTRQKIAFDPETGKPLREYFDLAANTDGCWARGLGWCVAGLCEAYTATQSGDVLSALEKVVEFYWRSTPDDKVCYWDLKLPNPSGEPRDTSAAALVTYGLVRLQGEGETIQKLRNYGELMLTSLCQNYVILDKQDFRRGMVLHGCYNKSSGYAADHELIWTNYYIAYALDYLLSKNDQ